MKVAVFLAVLALGAALKTEVTPVSKVIQMLEGMLAQGKREKEEEQAVFVKYAAFCHDTEMEKTWAIDDAGDELDSLNADIQKYISDVEKITREIEAHDGDVATWTGDQKAAAAVRKGEHTDYETTHQDYSESIDALERAITTLKKQDYTRGQASLLELKSMSLIPSHAKRVITSFLAQDADTEGFLDFKAPEATGYEFQSGGVIEMLEKLLTKFEDERASLEREETEAEHAYNMLNQDLANQISVATEQRNAKSEEKSNKEQAIADAKASVEETAAAKKSDEKFLDEVRSMCAQKKAEFESRQELRAGELDALAKAIDIISTQVTGLADKHLPTMVQTSLVQLRAHSSIKTELVSFLSEQAKKLNSRMLFQLAARAQDDPFKKVKSMIQDLITRLMEEANEEAEHKGWCDTELATNEQTRKAKTDEIDTLTAQIDKLTADIGQLGNEIVNLNEDISAIDNDVAEATEQRQSENAKNVDTIKDCQDAQDAVSQALAVLKEFYTKASDATALYQQQQPSDEQLRARDVAPDTWSGSFNGQQAGAGGVVGMLEVIQSDFARLEAETKESEDTAAAAYKQFMEESALNKLAKSKDVDFKSERKNVLETNLATTSEDRAGAQKELDAALAYYEKLKPSCVDAGVAYEDRVARRKEEIESLQEALRILSGEDIAA